MRHQRIHDARTFVRPNFSYQLTQTDRFAGITQHGRVTFNGLMGRVSA